jgi:hypothetical protein
MTGEDTQVVANRDIVVIGGSAGSLDAINQIVASLPPDLGGAIFVVIHLSPRSPNYIPEILRKRTAMGAAGLWEIAKRNGITVVQDPAEAAFPSMPLNALNDAIVHHTLTVSEIGRLLTELVGEKITPTSRREEVLDKSRPVLAVLHAPSVADRCTRTDRSRSNFGAAWATCCLSELCSRNTPPRKSASCTRRSLRWRKGPTWPCWWPRPRRA